MKIKDLTLIDKLKFILIFLLLGILPLVVLYTKVNVPPSLVSIYGTEVVDFFAYTKSRILLGLIIIITILNFYDFYSELDDNFDIKKFVKNPIFIGSVLIIIFTIVSFIFSDYKDVVINGAIERFESIFIGIGYIFIMTFIAKFCKSRTNVELVVFSIVFGAFIIGLIGTLQYIEFETNLFPNLALDPFNWEFVKSIYIGNRLDTTNEALKFNFAQVYTTLYNPNYVGMYGALFIPIGISAIFYYNKKSFMKWISLLTTVLIFISTIGSKSDAGIIAMAVTLVFSLIIVGMYYFKVLKNNKVILSIIGLFFTGVLLLIVSIFTIPTVKNLADSFYVAVFGINDGSDLYSIDNELHLNLSGVNQKVVLYEDGVAELYEDDTNLLISRNFKEEPALEPITGEFSNGSKWTMLGDNTMLVYEFKNHRIGLTLIDGEIYLKNNKLEDVSLNSDIPSFGFEGMEKFGTGRGFIWSRSLPIAFKSMIVGSGSDTFMLIFPQNDLRGKLLYINNLFINVDKAHSIYLQYWLNTGFISLVGYLLILCATLVIAIKSMFCIGKDSNDDIKSIKQFKDDDRFKLILVTGFICAIVGYSVSGLTADQNIVVSPIFWSSMGLCTSKWCRYK